MTQPETLTPRQLAERLGFKPHYGNQLAKEGRFVLAPDGKRVLVQESIARFHATKDPSKQGVADRHAAGRAAAAPAQAEPPQDGDEDDAGGDAPMYDFHNAKAKREHWAAEREHAAFRKDAGDPDKIAARTKEYEDRFANPFVAASKGFVDEVIHPHSTRRRIALSLRKLRNKELENPWKKHDNIPL